jgi:hypothetical protein
MVDARGVVRLMDFGIAKQDHGDGLSMTVTGQIIGTPEYMSPEQVQAQRLDGRSDLYSLGIVVFEVFTGATPFRAETPLGTVLKHLNEPPPLEGPAATLLPPAIVPVLRRSLAKRREDRYASATEMARALEEARAATPIVGARTSRTAPPSSTMAPGETAVATLDQRTEQAGPTLRAATTRIVTGTVAEGPKRARGLTVAVASAAALAAAAVAVWIAQRPGSAPATANGPASPAPLAPAGSVSTPDATTAAPVPAPRESPTAPAAARFEEPGRMARAAPAASPTAGVATPAPPVPTPVVPQTQAIEAAVERLIAEGGAALEAQSYDTAIARYDEALRLDPKNALARMGRVTAVSAKSSRAAAPLPARAGFVAERTAAESVETRPDKALASAFEDAQGIEITRDTQPAQLPGRIEFRTQPASVGPGEAYKLEVRFVNAGRAAIEVQGLVVTTTVNGRRASGPVAPLVSTVAPGQSAAVLTLSDSLRADLESWSLEVVLHTSRGEGYRNRLVWSATGAAEPPR